MSSYSTSSMTSKSSNGTNSSTTSLQNVQVSSSSVAKTGSFLVDTMIIFVILLIGIAAAICAEVSSSAIPKINHHWSDNADLKSANATMAWASIIFWSAGAALLLFYIIFYWMFAARYNWFITIISIIIAILFIVAAIMMFYAVAKISQSAAYDNNNPQSLKAYKVGVLSGILALIAATGIVLWIIHAHIKQRRLEGGGSAFAGFAMNPGDSDVLPANSKPVVTRQGAPVLDLEPDVLAGNRSLVSGSQQGVVVQKIPIQPLPPAGAVSRPPLVQVSR